MVNSGSHCKTKQTREEVQCIVNAALGICGIQASISPTMKSGYDKQPIKDIFTLPSSESLNLIALITKVETLPNKTLPLLILAQKAYINCQTYTKKCLLDKHFGRKVNK